MSEITLYEILKKKFSPAEVDTIISSIKTAVKEEVSNQKDRLATREELLKMKIEIIKWVVGLFIVQSAMIIGLYLKK